MKKITALLLILALCLGLGPTLGEEESAPGPAGDWYAVWKDITLQLTLQADGAYSLRVLGTEKALSGAWAEEDGFITLTGDFPCVLSYDETVLRQAEMSLFFYREPLGGYAPAEVRTDLDASAFNGCWYSRYVLVENAALPAAWAGQDVRMYIEETTAAITGTGFDDEVIPFDYENGVLTAHAEGRDITLQLQQDFALRMTILEDGKETTLVLSYFFLDSLFPEE